MRLRLERNLAEGLLVLSDILAEDIEERLGLLRADVDALGVFDSDLVSGVLADQAKGEEEIPNAYPDLHAVSVVFAIVLRFLDVNLRLGMTRVHIAKGIATEESQEWCERGDLNPHGFPRQILSLVRLPIPPLSHALFQLLTATILSRRLAGHQFRDQPFRRYKPIHGCLSVLGELGGSIASSSVLYCVPRAVRP